jgi:hypothetical protein
MISKHRAIAANSPPTTALLSAFSCFLSPASLSGTPHFAIKISAR